ncbi:MAG: hypothetical protein RMJ14_02780 [Nitrososphaerota archaeon]|nr:hypothetical protein [Aigarchaeota archaeon]MDW8076546.1 hypothetical protein [Nitrososphaerota archaeon]
MAQKKSAHIIEFDHVDKLELKVLQLPRPVASVDEYLKDAELRGRAECIETVKVPSHSEDWEDVEMKISEMGFDVVEWHIGDKKDLILVSKKPTG